MTSRLPNPGNDSGSWGTILNTFLEVSFNPDGTVNTGAIATASGVTAGTLAWQANTNYNINQLVIYNSQTYISNLKHTSGGGFNGLNWTVLSSSGGGGVTIDYTNTPAPDTSLGNPGTSSLVAAAGHSHPLSMLGRAMMFNGYPPNLSPSSDYTFDGIWNGSITNLQTNDYVGFTFGGNPTNIATISGTTYTLRNTILRSRNIVIPSGITLFPRNASGAIILLASQSITISGSLVVNGNPATGATAGIGVASATFNYQGGTGATGGTGAGGTGAGTGNAGPQIGGAGGQGGASGATAGGAGNNGGNTNYVVNPASWTPGAAFPFLTGNYNGFNDNIVAPTTSKLAFGGSGGSAGAGDGTHAGGGGGAGGGIIILLAPQINIGNGAILTAVGGAGGNGTAANAGGGGGGGGGQVCLHALGINIGLSATLTVIGGPGGNGAGTGQAGFAGGISGFADPPTIYGGFGFGPGCLICQWQ